MGVEPITTRCLIEVTVPYASGQQITDFYNADFYNADSYISHATCRIALGTYQRNPAHNGKILVPAWPGSG